MFRGLKNSQFKKKKIFFENKLLDQKFEAI